MYLSEMMKSCDWEIIEVDLFHIFQSNPPVGFWGRSCDFKSYDEMCLLRSVTVISACETDL